MELRARVQLHALAMHTRARHGPAQEAGAVAARPPRPDAASSAARQAASTERHGRQVGSSHLPSQRDYYEFPPFNEMATVFR